MWSPMIRSFLHFTRLLIYDNFCKCNYFCFKSKCFEDSCHLMFRFSNNCGTGFSCVGESFIAFDNLLSRLCGFPLSCSCGGLFDTLNNVGITFHTDSMRPTFTDLGESVANKTALLDRYTTYFCKRSSLVLTSKFLLLKANDIIQ